MISEINKRIRSGDAIVLTDAEFTEKIGSGHELSLSDVDVVTVELHSPMSGTAAMLCVPVTGRGIFTRAKKIWLNGTPGFPGPAPNERLGEVDTLIFAGQAARDKQNGYNSAKLFFDMIKREEVQVECLSQEGDTYRNTFTLDQIPFARMYVYNCFFDGLPVTDENRQRIPNRHFNTISTGSKVLLNKALGIVIGYGSRSSPERPSLSMAADMFKMDPDAMVSSENASGPVIENSLTLAIPVLDEGVLKDLSAWLTGRNFGRSQKSLTVPEIEMARYLKELIIRGNFLLTKSDEVGPSAFERVNP
ncbi:MAG: hypothetical protein M1497_11900 [Nitrospirae bacterium]|nr:hypothetical protein [Nitrospirota bacterium]